MRTCLRPTEEAENGRDDDPRNETGQKKRPDRGITDNGIKDHRSGGWDQNAQRAASGDNAIGVSRPVTEPLHLRYGG